MPERTGNRGSHILEDMSPEDYIILRRTQTEVLLIRNKRFKKVCQRFATVGGGALLLGLASIHPVRLIQNTYASEQASIFVDAYRQPVRETASAIAVATLDAQMLSGQLGAEVEEQIKINNQFGYPREITPREIKINRIGLLTILIAGAGTTLGGIGVVVTRSHERILKRSLSDLSIPKPLSS